jgi:Putative prokaryotic signal transducing protein
MKCVYTAPNSLMVDHLKLVLDSAGIDSVVEHRQLSSGVGGIPPQETWPELWILDDSQETRALELIARADAEAPAAGQRVCLACGERFGAQFDTCWKCGAPAGSLLRDAHFLRQDERPIRRPLSRMVVYWLIWAAMAWAALAMLRAYTE